MKDIYNNYKDIGLFNNGDFLVYSFKKTERIVSAIYLVTGLIKDSEPIKWELRELCMSLVSLMTSLNSNDLVDKNLVFHNYFTTSLQVISFINVLSNNGLVSSMNSNILKREIESILIYLKEQSRNANKSAGYILSDSFFAVDQSASGDKGHIITKISSDDLHRQKDNTQFIKDRKESRKDSILNLLSKSPDLTIKDFVKVITDCSEKTIQRELIDLVEKGLIKRKGERRWSTYSLA